MRSTYFGGFFSIQALADTAKVASIRTTSAMLCETVKIHGALNMASSSHISPWLGRLYTAPLLSASESQKTCRPNHLAMSESK